MPPSPMRAVTEYGPRVVPGLRGMSGQLVKTEATVPTMLMVKGQDAFLESPAVRCLH